ncbi:hypothetical protein P9012_29115, partial [Bacillus thuringiensis]|nr:hypothetical protein [Bacillus cereus]MEC3120342.1 hypothetical protein [Bacillus thuringiensis]
MLKYHFPNVCEDELINIYSYGDFKGQGKYICLFKIENQSFLFWRNDKGNKIYTNLESISVEIINTNNTYNQSQNVCPQDLVDTYNQSQNVCPQDLVDTYNQSQNVCPQDLVDTYNQSQNVCPQDLVDTYNQSQNVCPQD